MNMDQNQESSRHDGEEGKEAAQQEVHTIPKAILLRIMRQAMPGNSKIAGDAKEAMDKCVSEFAAVVIRAAKQECRRDRRLTITGDDLIVGMSNLGFNDYVGPLNEYLRRYRESEGIMPRGRHSAMPPPSAPAPAAAPAEDAEEEPPSPGLTLQLAPPTVADVTELGLHTDVYAVWRAGAPVAAAAAAAPAAGPSSPAPPAGDDDEWSTE